ncbi:MAG: thiamine pyrophosphate-dependent enzyme [bacterium]|nr:thiamine pyrophosphate-dependent enzyme [bacterium]
MSSARTAKKLSGPYPQKVDLLDGNAIAAISAMHIDFDVVGYYPITPSTQVAETLDALKADGQHDITMIPGDGEHGAAGICFGATAGGARVFNATSANGLLFSMEQLPVQSGSRFPMVLDIACRSVSGPLNIKGDHSDIMMALNAGWIMLLAKDPQMAYDLNIIAVKLGEHPDVRLPVIVAYDGFFTSHQKRRVYYFEDPSVVRDWLGDKVQENHALDPGNPVTIGPYMNEPDLINNKKQLSMAMEKAYKLLPGIYGEYGKLSGRTYSVLNSYAMEDAEAALFVLNSAFDTAKIAVDRLREKGEKVGVVTSTVIRPFPVKEIQAAFSGVKALMVGDRADSYGAFNGNMSMEIKAALKDDPDNGTQVLSRIYGLGGREFYVEDALELLAEALDTAKTGLVKVHFDYHGANPGDPDVKMERVVAPLTKEEQSPGIFRLEEKDGHFLLKGFNKRKLAAKPKRIVPGHGACPGCGIFPSLNTFLKGIEGNVIVQFHTGCAMVVTTGYPFSSHRITYIHNLFQNGAATMSGLVEAYHTLVRKGRLPGDEEFTFIMVTGDGGHDIGMGPSIGAAIRGHKMILLEYDNEAYMNTGTQLSFTTPIGHQTSTSGVGPGERGKSFHHKDTAQIFAACHIPYVFTAVETQPRDMVRKAAMAQKVAAEKGFVFGKVLSVCPLGWRTVEKNSVDIIQKAVDTCFYPLYEVYNGITTITYNPEEKDGKLPVIEWLKTMGKTRHLTKAENADIVEAFQVEVDRRWLRLKAVHENPIL